MIKKFSLLVLAIVLMLSVFPCTVSALDADLGFSLRSGEPTLVNSSGNTESKSWQFLSRYVDIDQFREHLIKGVSNCETEIDISAFKIPYGQEWMDAICDYLWYCVPEAFNFETAESSGYYDPYPTAYFKTLKPGYRDFADVAQEYDACYTKMVTVANKILDGIEDNEAFDDVQKALLLHDRLALWNEYDYDGLETKDAKIYTAYGALGEGKSVCQGYAMAYMYLLNRVGIDNYYCSSEELNHGWNIVYINDKAYHVDVTWDDYAWDIGERGAVGIVGHSNFLRSSNGIYSTGHEATDYDTTPIDTTYDNYFWQNSETAFQLVDNELYYIDNDNANLKRYSDGTVLCSVDDMWKYNEYYYWGNNARLSSDGVSLYYSLSKAIYKFDLATNTSKKIYEPSLSGYNSIYGFMYYDNYLICDINNVPPYSTYGLSNLYQEKVSYEEETPSYNHSGDINGDGKTNNKDLGLLMQYLNGWDVAISDTVADVNGDGRINNKDYGLLMQFVNGWDVVLK